MAFRTSLPVRVTNPSYTKERHVKNTREWTLESAPRLAPVPCVKVSFLPGLFCIFLVCAPAALRCALTAARSCRFKALLALGARDGFGALTLPAARAAVLDGFLLVPLAAAHLAVRSALEGGREATLAFFASFLLFCFLIA